MYIFIHIHFNWIHLGVVDTKHVIYIYIYFQLYAFGFGLFDCKWDAIR